MSITGISSGSASLSSEAINAIREAMKQSKMDLKSLGAALESGDLEAAREAFAKWQEDLPAPASVGQARRSGSVGTALGPPFKDQIDALQGALDSGDLQAAQDAFAALVAAMQSAPRDRAHTDTGRSSRLAPVDPSQIFDVTA